MRNWRLAVLSLALLGVGARCRQPLCVPPAGQPIRLAIVVKATAAGKCTTETFPQCQHARPKDVLLWSVIDAGGKCKKVSLQFPANTEIIQLDDKDPVAIKGTVTGKKGRYKYSVLVDGKVTEDPEIEIWP